MQEYFLKLFQYNEWANRRILNACETLSENSEMLKILAHTSRAQEVWLSRILNTEAQQKEIFPEWNFEKCREELLESSEEWTAFIETCMDEHFKEEHYYKNSKGDSYRSTLEDVIIHVINHSTYHRAQLNRILREEGEEAAITDYIFYTRDELEGVDIELN